MCAGGRRPARPPSAPRASLGASSRSPARPCRRPPAPRQIPPAPFTPAALVVLVCPARPCRRPPAPRQDPPAPFTPVVLVVLVCSARPRRRPPALRQVPLAPFGALRTGVTCVAACGLVRVVTNVVNPRCFSCGFLSRCYKRRQSGGFFADNGGFLAWIDDVCNRGPREAI